MNETIMELLLEYIDARISEHESDPSCESGDRESRELKKKILELVVEYNRA